MLMWGLSRLSDVSFVEICFFVHAVLLSNVSLGVRDVRGSSIPRM
jgi:hypothetical protein